MPKKQKILIVDDEPDIRLLYGDELTEAGFEVSTASDGAEGIKLAGKIHPDLILMDMKMPGMDGVDAFVKIHDDPATQDIKVVFLSAFGDPHILKDDNKIAVEFGANGFIRKGIDLQEFVKKIKEFLK